MYITLPVIILAIFIIVGMTIKLRAERKKRQILLWDLSELYEISRWYLPIASKLEAEIVERINEKQQGDSNQWQSPNTYHSLCERMKLYEDGSWEPNVLDNVDVNLINQSTFFNDDIIDAHNIIRRECLESYLGKERLDKLIREISPKKYKQIVSYYYDHESNY